MGLKTCCFLLFLLKSLSCSDDKDASCMFSSCVNCHGHFLWGKHAIIQHLQSASTFTSLLFISFDYDIDCQRLEIREANLTFLYSGTTRILIHNLYLSCFYLECWLTQTSALFLTCSEYKLYRGASNIEVIFFLGLSLVEPFIQIHTKVGWCSVIHRPKHHMVDRWLDIRVHTVCDFRLCGTLLPSVETRNNQ